MSHSSVSDIGVQLTALWCYALRLQITLTADHAQVCDIACNSMCSMLADTAQWTRVFRLLRISAKYATTAVTALHTKAKH